jgi:hypothetical protein
MTCRMSSPETPCRGDVVANLAIVAEPDGDAGVMLQAPVQLCMKHLVSFMLRYGYDGDEIAHVATILCHRIAVRAVAEEQRHADERR